MTFTCGPSSTLLGITAPNNASESFATPRTLVSIDSTTGAVRTLCHIDDTSTSAHVLVAVNPSTLLYFSGTVSPTMSTIPVRSDGSVASQGGLCLLSAVVQYSVNAPAVLNGTAISAALSANDGALVYGVAGSKVVSINISGNVATLASLSSAANKLHTPVGNVTA